LRLREPEDIIAEARNLANMGTKELVLIAQDTTAHPRLSDILSGLEEIDGLRWIRLLYTHPAHLTEELIEQMVSSEKILNYLDMPVQHLADSVLDRMNRKVGFEKIRGLVVRARSLDPEFAVRTTVIVGFPGETDAEFKFLMDNLEELKFTHLGIFAYSPEDDTEASAMPDQVEWKTIRKRVLELVESAERMQQVAIKKLTGTVQEALVDFVEEDGTVGRLWNDAPEIDRVLTIQGSDPGPGSFGKVRIIGGKDDEIIADWLESD